MLRLLRSNKGFARFIISRFVHDLAVSATPILLTLSVLQGGGSATSLAFVLGVGALPAVGGALFSRWVTARLTVRGVLIASTLTWVFVMGVTGILKALGRTEFIWLIAISFILELNAAIKYPALRSYVTRIVPKDDLQVANSLRSLASGIAAISGPIIFSFAGSAIPMSIAWFILSGLLLFSLLPLKGLPKGEIVESEAPEPWVTEVRKGWQFFFRSPGIRTVVLTSGLWHLIGWSVILVSGPVILHDRGNLAAWGWVQAAITAGMLAGASLAGRIKVMRLPRFAVLGLCPALVFGLLLSFSLPVFLLVAAAALVGFSLSIAGILWDTGIQANVPEEQLEVIFSFDYLFSEAFEPLGLLFVPILIALFASEIILLRYVSLALLILLIVIAFLAPQKLTARSLSDSDNDLPLWVSNEPDD